MFSAMLPSTTTSIPDTPRGRKRCSVAFRSRFSSPRDGATAFFGLRKPIREATRPASSELKAPCPNQRRTRGSFTAGRNARNGAVNALMARTLPRTPLRNRAPFPTALEKIVSAGTLTAKVMRKVIGISNFCARERIRMSPSASPDAK